MPPAHETQWSPMAKNFKPAQIMNLHIIHCWRVQSWNSNYNWSLQTIAFEDWYASIRGYEGEEHNFELWYWTSWLEQQGLDVNFFLSPLLIPPGFLVPVVETHPYYCCYTGCRRSSAPFSSRQARDLHFFTQHCNERSIFCCDIGDCVKRYQSPYSLTRHQRIVHRIMPY
ncbi:hypothetical protein FB446DRAFT_773145 [Lentinula raphanica]|nr:hypothetical protein FB446DRAFT_773145 [Lentinula raphanica]